DFARVYYHYLTVTNCARNGALFGSAKPSYAQDTAGIQTAALADATNLSPTPTVTSATGNDAAGNPYIDVTVRYPFQTITAYCVSNTITLTRTVRMRVAPAVPKNS